MYLMGRELERKLQVLRPLPHSTSRTAPQGEIKREGLGAGGGGTSKKEEAKQRAGSEEQRPPPKMKGPALPAL